MHTEKNDVSLALDDTKNSNQPTSKRWPPPSIPAMPLHQPPVRKRRSRLHWKRLLLAAVTLLFILGLGTYSLYRIVGFFFNGNPPFCHVLPKNTPLAIEGSPDAVLSFLNTRIKPTALRGLPFATAGAKSECVLFAQLPGVNGNASRDCQRNLIKLVNTIEDSWNTNSSYPQTLPLLPPCPAHGHLKYVSDGESFHLTCQSESHQTVYDSNSGLETARNAKPVLIAGFYRPAEHIEGSFTIAGHKNIEFVSNYPVKAKMLLENAEQSTGTLALANAPDAPLRISLSAQRFYVLFPQASLRLPPDVRVSAWQNAEGNRWSGRADLQQESAFVANATAGTNCLAPEKMLSSLPDTAMAVAGSTPFLRALSLWPADCDADAANAPGTVGVSTNEYPTPMALYPTIAKSLAGRTNCFITSSFAPQKNARNWLAATSVGDVFAHTQSQKDCQATLEKNSLTLQLGPKLTPGERPDLPTGPSEPLCLGWASISDNSQLKVSAFSMGIVEGILWGEVTTTNAKLPAANKQ